MLSYPSFWVLSGRLPPHTCISLPRRIRCKYSFKIKLVQPCFYQRSAPIAHRLIAPFLAQLLNFHGHLLILGHHHRPTYTYIHMHVLLKCNFDESVIKSPVVMSCHYSCCSVIGVHREHIDVTKLYIIVYANHCYSIVLHYYL